MSQDISTKEIYKCEECREKDNKIAELEAELKAWEELRQKQEVSVEEVEEVVWQFHGYLCSTKLDIAKGWVKDIAKAIWERIYGKENK